MNSEIEYTENFDHIELIKLKYLELKDSMIGKYFFLYFLHLNGILDYKEQNSQCIFSNKDTTFEVPLPIIDSDEKYRELERVHKNLEKFSLFLKSKAHEFKNLEINLIDI